MLLARKARVIARRSLLACPRSEPRAESAQRDHAAGADEERAPTAERADFFAQTRE
jgi:hypothetical protein